MAEFPVNPQRVDPYEASKFRVKWDGKYIPAITRVSPLVRFTQVVPHREGGGSSNVHLQPGENAFQAVTLERGLTQDRSFEIWADAVWNIASGLGTEVELKNMRKDIRIELMNEAGQIVLAWNMLRCWPSEYQPLSELGSGAATDAAERLVLQNEGWERDASVIEPVEP
ncbi:MAG TPA: phage tail protein [Acidobacteriaceae bacterium]|jgi:phage tail-like protein